MGYAGDETGLGGEAEVSGYLAGTGKRTGRLICGI